MWVKVAPVARRKARVKKLSLEVKRSWRGRQVARRKAMPEDIPVRRVWWRWKARAKATRMLPPSNGPRPKSKETRKPDAPSELHLRKFC